MNELPHIPTAPGAFVDFKGGITDYALGGPLHKYERADNFLIQRYDQLGKLWTRPGSELYDADFPQIPAGSQRIGSMVFFDTWLLIQSSRHIYSLDGSGFATLSGPTANAVFPTTVDTTSVVTYATWNNHLYATASTYTKPQKLFKNGAGVLQVRTAGLPRLASDPTITPTSVGTTQLYSYLFIHRIDYTVDTVSFTDRSMTREVLVETGAVISGANTQAITVIPVLANGATDNYDTSTALKIEIYRTVANGNAWYKAGSVNNGTTTFNDTMTDATLVLQEPLYTSGGDVENEPPPQCALIHVVGDVGYVGRIKEGSEVILNEVRQSIPGDPDSIPADFSVTFDDELVGLSSHLSTPVLCCKKSAYRIDGLIDAQGRGVMLAVKISDTATCASAAGVIQTPLGVFWVGNDAIFWSNGFNVQKVNTGWNKTHKLLVATAEQRSRITGAYDRNENRVWWGFQTGSEVDKCYVLDLNWGMSDDMPFTTASGGEDGAANWAPTAMAFNETGLVRGDKRGFIFQHSEAVDTDPEIDTGAAPADWGTAAIIYDYLSCATNFGDDFERKFIPRIVLQAQNKTNLSLQIVSYNDDGARVASLKPIRYRGDMTWGDENVFWGDDSYVWDAAGLIEAQRRFPGNHLRCSYKAIGLTNAEVVIVTSDLLGTCDISSTAKTATLTDSVGFDWPTDVSGYKIAFQRDLDVTYNITARANDVLTFEDVDNTSVTATAQEWELRGKPKGEAFQLLSFTLQFGEFGKTQALYTKDSAGGVE